MMRESSAVMETLQAHRKANKQLVKAIIRARKQLAEDVHYTKIYGMLGKALEQYTQG